MRDWGWTAFMLAGGVLLASGFFHTAVWLGSGTGWEGPLSWRKSILFAFSAGVTCLSLAWLVRRLRPWRGDVWLSVSVAIALTLEVALITLQTWRGVPSHFNTATPLDACIHDAMGWLIGFVTLAISVWTLRAFFPMATLREECWAARIGMGLLLLGCLIGGFISLYGQWRLQAGLTPEYHGEAGVLKFPHGVPLHAIQWLILATWLVRALAWSETAAMRLVVGVGIGQICFTAFAIWQTWHGLARWDLDAVGTILLSLGFAATLAPLVPPSQ